MTNPDPAPVSTGFAVGSAITALVLLFALNLWFFSDTTRWQSRTSFGTGIEGYGAVYDLLSELGFAVGRTYDRPAQTPVDRVVWYVRPSFLTPEPHESAAEARELEDWIARGATAIVFGDDHSEWQALDIAAHSPPPGDTPVDGSGHHPVTIAGDLVRGERVFAPTDRIELGRPNAKDTGILRFSDVPEGMHVRLTADGAPFALERAIGTGRLIAIADARILENVTLANADASLVAVDLAQALGSPSFDERSHGLRAPTSILAALGSRRAVTPLLALTVVAVLWIAEARRWPARRLRDVESPPLALTAFVQSVGTRYARTGEHAAVFAAYRRGFLHRLGRRTAGGELREDVLLDRIARDRTLEPVQRRWLLEKPPPASARELRDAVAALESYRAG